MMPKKNLIFMILAIMVLSFVTYFFLRGNTKIKNYPPKNQTVVAFGDSLVEGVGASVGNDFVSLVGRNLGIEIINKGLSGDTTAGGLERVDDVINLDPGIVILLLGGNDVLRRISKEETFKNLSTIIEKLQNSGGVVLLLGVRGGILYDSYEEDFKKLSEKYHTLYVSNVLDNLITRPEYMSDGIHPNDKGYAIIAERVAPVLKNILK